MTRSSRPARLVALARVLHTRVCLALSGRTPLAAAPAHFRQVKAFRVPRSARAACAPLAAALACACQGADGLGPCTAQQTAIDSTFHTYADSGLPIASFALHQLYSSFPDGCSRDVGGPVALVIFSDAFVPLAFGFTLRGYDEKANRDWSYDGRVVRMAPADSIDEGTIGRARVRIDVNTRVGFDSVRVVP